MAAPLTSGIDGNGKSSTAVRVIVDNDLYTIYARDSASCSHSELEEEYNKKILMIQRLARDNQKLRTHMKATEVTARANALSEQALLRFQIDRASQMEDRATRAERDWHVVKHYVDYLEEKVGSIDHALEDTCATYTAQNGLGAHPTGLVEDKMKAVADHVSFAKGSITMLQDALRDR